MKDVTPAQSPVLGGLTYTDIGQTEPFFAPMEKDAWGFLRAPFSPQIARMSAELASDVYGLQIQDWIRAGWTDSTFVIEDRVFRLDSDSDSRFAALENEWRRRRAKSLVHGARPIADLLRTARQLLVTDMGKSLVMTRALPDGRALIAISFMGTTEKLYDWYTNFKFQQKSGMHQGFLETARQFDAQADRVLLPSLTETLQSESFTLADALRLAGGGDARFTFWLSGHSQGGALVQTYAHLLMDKGIAPEKIVAYSLAAPSVAFAGGVPEPGRYPVYNILNADDVVTRVGAQVRLGVDCLFQPQDSFRQAHYRMDPDVEAARNRFFFIADQVQSTKDALHLGIAVVRLMRMEEAGETLETLAQALIPHLPMIKRLGLSVEEIALYLDGKLMEHIRALTLEEPEHALIARFGELLLDALNEFGAKATAKALAECVVAPHGIRRDKKDEEHVPPYIALVRKYLFETERGIWSASLPPLCINAQGEKILPKETRALYLLEENGNQNIKII